VRLSTSSSGILYLECNFDFTILIKSSGIIVWRSFSTDFWVSFKAFGIMPLTMVFALLQVPLILKYEIKSPEDDGQEEAGGKDQDKSAGNPSRPDPV
jgi:hypothetical protein